MASRMLVRNLARKISRVPWQRQSAAALHADAPALPITYDMTDSLANAGIKRPLAPCESETAPILYYDVLAMESNRKIQRVKTPDPRFLKYADPVPALLDHTDILTLPDTKVTALPNGMRIATETNMASEIATIGVWIDAGSRFETDDTHGTAHFLEHMLFKGTHSRTGKELEEAIENMGGVLTGYTSREQTTYYIKVQKRDVPQAMEIIADILQNSSMLPENIEMQRRVIERELEEVADQGEEVILNHLHATAFQYSPLGKTITGPIENVKKMTKEQLEHYIATHFTAPRMVVSASGAVEHEQIVELTKKLFTKFSDSGTLTADLVAKEPTIFTGSEVRMTDMDKPLAHFAVAFSGASWTDPDAVALMVMQTMMGTWNKSSGGGKHMGSEMVQRIAINELAESVMAFNTNYKDAGLFGVYAIAKPNELQNLAYVIMQAFTKMIYRVSDSDVTRARNQLKSSFIRHVEGTGASADDIGRQMLAYGRRLSMAELFARIDAVDGNTVRRVANRFLFDKDIAIAAMGAVDELPDYNWFRRRTYWLRY